MFILNVVRDDFEVEINLIVKLLISLGNLEKANQNIPSIFFSQFNNMMNEED
jgi:hypothetical protein